jgi:hypothetical protein
MGVSLVVSVVHTTNNFAACYGSGRLTFNLLRLGHRWFEQGASEDVDRLLIHELCGTAHNSCNAGLSVM